MREKIPNAYPKETRMNPKFRLVTCLALVFVVLMTSGASLAFASPTCNSTFVKQSGNAITVRPTGTDDTVNIQCAFDIAVTSGHDKQVQLLAGTFHTKQIVVNGFRASFTGAGAEKTVVMNLPNLYVTPVNMYFNPPSAANPWPSLISFIDSDLAISDLAIRIVGSAPTMGWTIFGIDPPIKELAIGIGILGTHANARVSNVLVEGEVLPVSRFGYNLINGIYFEGFIGEVSAPMAGTFTVFDSTFRKVASGAPIFNLSGASVMISRNRFDNVFYGMDTADLMNTSLAYSHNTVDATICLDLYNITNTETSGANLFVANNVCHGTRGMVLETTFSEGNKCLLVGNNVQNVTDVGYYLGPGINGCTVIGDGHPATAINLGTDNRLINITGHGKNSPPPQPKLLRPLK
jgi:hypothetical protein